MAAPFFFAFNGAMEGRLIRPVRRDDMAAITAIYRDAVLNGTATYEIDPPDEDEMARRMAAMTGGGYPYLVAELDGNVVGSGYAAPYRSRPAYRWTVEDSIYLAADARGKGIGGGVLAALIAESESRGFRQMIAVIGDSRHLPSIRLHRAAGFAEAGVLSNVGYKHGHWLDTVLMERSLGRGATTAPDLDTGA